MYIRVVLWGFLSYLVVAAASTHAQVSTGTISGTIRDSSGAVLPRATVTLLNEETGVTRTTQSDSAGRYTAPSLSLGRYRVTATQDGFQTEVRRGIILAIGQEAVVNFALQVGLVTQTIEVTGEAPLVETTGATVSGLVGEREMADLPLNGRSFDQLITLDSGAANYTAFAGRSAGQGFASKFTIAGMRWESNKFYQDGTEMLGAAKGADQPGSASGLQLGVDAIREFRVLTNNYSAEYGKKAGGAVITVTKSGTNELHGNAFAFHRNDNLDARNFFDREIPEFKRNNFGAAMGGPIIRDRMFFFGNYEGVRQRLGITQIGIVPDENARNGLLPAPGGGLRQVPINPTMPPYVALFPLPNGRNFDDGTGEVFNPAPTETDEDFGMGRIDYVFSENDSFFLSYTTSTAQQLEPETVPISVSTARTRNHTASLEEKHIFSPTLLHVFRVGFNRSFYVTEPVRLIDIDPSLSFIPGAPMGGLAFQTAHTGLGFDGPQETTNNLFQFSEQFFYTKGSHTLNMGWQIQRIQRNEIQTDRQLGEFRFANWETFLAGTPNRFSGLIPPLPPGGRMLNIGIEATQDLRKGWRQTYGGFHVQDSWKALSNLTVDAGLRFEFLTAPSEVNGKTHQFVVDRVSLVAPAGIFLQTTPRVGIPIVNATSIAMAPRLGLAWDPWGSDRATVRAGFGVFYEHLDNYYRFYQDSSPPFTTRAEFGTNLNFPRPFEGRTVDDIRVEGRTIDFHIDPATVFHYNFGIQQELSPGWAVKLGYVGSKGYHLTNNPSVNLVPADIRPDGSKFFPAGRPLANPILGVVNMLMGNANSWYNSLRIEMEKRFGSGGNALDDLRLKWAYTFGKSTDQHSINQNSAGRNAPGRQLDPLDLAREKALSNFDVRHSMTFNFTYGLPRAYSGGVGAALLSDWSLNGILTANSGYPGTIQVGFSRSRNGEESIADRPDLTSGASTSPVLGGPDRYFDPQGFLLPEAGTYGNLGRNTLSMPGLVTFDSSLVKGFSISERFSLQFRTEFFNLLNRANFGAPNLRLFNSNGSRIGSAGRISNTLTTARQIQFGLRLEF